MCFVYKGIGRTSIINLKLSKHINKVASCHILNVFLDFQVLSSFLNDPLPLLYIQRFLVLSLLVAYDSTKFNIIIQKDLKRVLYYYFFIHSPKQ